MRVKYFVKKKKHHISKTSKEYFIYNKHYNKLMNIKTKTIRVEKSMFSYDK